MKKQHVIKFLLLISILFGLSAAGYCQAEIKLENRNKKYYKTGETIDAEITVTLDEKICEAGVRQTKIFTKGLKINQQSEWKRISANTWVKNITLQIIGNRDDEIQLTVMRRADIDPFTEIMKFNVK